MLVKLIDVRHVYEFAVGVKSNAFSDTHIDFLWFCDDVIDNLKSIIQPTLDQIGTLKKWYEESITKIQKDYSEKTDDGNIKTEPDTDGNNVIVFASDEMKEKYKSAFNELNKTLQEKEQIIVDKLNEEVEISDISKISKTTVPKIDIKPVVFESLKKFIER